MHQKEERLRLFYFSFTVYGAKRLETQQEFLGHQHTTTPSAAMDQHHNDVNNIVEAYISVGTHI